MTTPTHEEIAVLKEAFRKADANSALEGIVPSGYQLLLRERIYLGELDLDAYGQLVLDRALAGEDLTPFEVEQRDKYLAGAITISQYGDRVLEAVKGAA